MHEMMKELITSKPIYQLPHVKDLMNDLDNNYKPTNLVTKNVINFNDNKTKKNAMKKPQSHCNISKIY
jgi:succinate dehydrogenase/fumarate reductase-like Fe-S protein